MLEESLRVVSQYSPEDTRTYFFELRLFNRSIDWLSARKRIEGNDNGSLLTKQCDIVSVVFLLLFFESLGDKGRIEGCLLPFSSRKPD